MTEQNATDRYGTPLQKGDPALWTPGDVDDDATLVRVLDQAGGGRLMVEFWPRERHSDYERPSGFQALIDQVNASLSEHGEGASQLPLDSPLVVPGAELEYFGEWDED